MDIQTVVLLAVIGAALAAGVVWSRRRRSAPLHVLPADSPRPPYNAPPQPHREAVQHRASGALPPWR
jgi:uncharacterized iron-regulated membrane protein